MSTGPWVIDMPISRPVSASLLNVNQRKHWTRRAELTKYWRYRARYAAAGCSLPTLQRAHIVVEISFGDKRKRDAGNYSLTGKAIVDGLVDYGLLPDDNDRHLVGPDLRRGDHATPRIRVRIVELPTTEENPDGNS